jgi:hypothetical protein
VVFIVGAFFIKGNRTDQNAARTRAAGNGSTEPLLNFHFLRHENANRSPHPHHISTMVLIQTHRAFALVEDFIIT